MVYSTDDGDEKIIYLSTTCMERTLGEHWFRWESNIKIEPKVNNVGECELVSLGFERRVAGFCENGNELSCYLKYKEFPDRPT
jgi:hypothetical protein